MIFKKRKIMFRRERKFMFIVCVFIISYTRVVYFFLFDLKIYVSIK
jgi:hypothetical protein